MQSQWVHIETIANSPKQPGCVGWASLNGVNPNGAVLVRPDGIVLWRFKEPGLAFLKASQDPDQSVTGLLRIADARGGLAMI